MATRHVVDICCPSQDDVNQVSQGVPVVSGHGPHGAQPQLSCPEASKARNKAGQKPIQWGSAALA